MPFERPRDALSEMLSRTLGTDTARLAVDRAANDLGMGTHLTREQALQILERIAEQSGIVGIAARFAKSRVHLVWGPMSA